MSAIKWIPKYEIGIEEIDKQHKYLFELADKLVDSDIKKSHPLILELFKYTRYHFETEEKLLGNQECYNLVEHKKLHDNLLTELNNLTKDGVTSQKELNDLTMFVVDWLRQHVLQEDCACKKVKMGESL